jgi:hypothetical protein
MEMLPGLGRLKGSPSRQFVKAPGWHSFKPRDFADQPEQTGPAEGQMVMHHRDLGKMTTGVTHAESWFNKGSYTQFDTADEHGNFQHRAPATFPTPREFERAQADEPTVSDPMMYETLGGANHADRKVRDHWVNQPQVNVSTETPLHTAQSPRDTERYGDLEGITEELQRGGEIRKPVWIMKHQDRLFVLDGHHRIAAARLAGRSQFPARVWDRDAEQ